MTKLHQVAEYLSQQAKALAGDDADAFGRSAFNRYYYATYLTTRELLSMLDSSWERQSHSTIPELLEITFLKKVRHQAGQLEKGGLITSARRQSIVSSATQASADIANILRSAYGVRVVADYQPKQLVGFSSSEFMLANHTNKEARNWQTRVEGAKGTLIAISRELGFV